MTPQPPTPLGVSEEMQELIDRFVSAVRNEVTAKGLTYEPGRHARVVAEQSLLTTIAALEAQLPQWQPIETAPKDGTMVLIAWAGGGYPRTSRWLHNSQGWAVATTQTLDPTHWMPLPPSPTGP